MSQLKIQCRMYEINIVVTLHFQNLNASYENRTYWRHLGSTYYHVMICKRFFIFEIRTTPSWALSAVWSAFQKWRIVNKSFPAATKGRPFFSENSMGLKKIYQTTILDLNFWNYILFVLVLQLICRLTPLTSVAKKAEKFKWRV